MGTVSAAAATAAQQQGQGVRSREAHRAAWSLLDAPRDARFQVLRTLDGRERAVIFKQVREITGTLYGLWHDAPVEFVEDVIGETLWGKQVAIAEACVTHKRIIVPAGFGVGKTFFAGRLVAWAGATNPVGTMVIVTTATRERQVKYQLWPHIRTAVAKAGLPGWTDTMQWKAPGLDGHDVVIAYGFSAPPTDEAAMQGIHGTPKLWLLVDEAGGIAPMIGKGTNNLLTGDAKMLAIGNPAMNEPGSWFERMSNEGESGNEPTTATIRIAALDSPAITGAPAPICRACVPNLDGHTIADTRPGKVAHLPDREWLIRTLREYGEDPALADTPNPDLSNSHAYIVAKVFARFPEGAGDKVMPASWVDAAQHADEPLDHTLCDHPGQGCTATVLQPGYVRLCDLGLDGETETHAVKKGAWIRLGVDVAADGGDELAIYRAVGDMVHKVHVSAGAANADAVKVAETVREQVYRAEKLAEALGTEHPVRVKVDANGLGWGVLGMLDKWSKTGAIKATVVRVMVSELPFERDEAAVMRPYRKRDEMWLNGRFLLQPDPATGLGRLRLRVDEKCAKQLSIPKSGSNAAGDTVVESKKDVKRRTGTDSGNSPDRAEAALLALYEPEPIRTKKRRGLLN